MLEKENFNSKSESNKRSKSIVKIEIMKLKKELFIS